MYFSRILYYFLQMRNIHNATFFIPYIYIMHEICPFAKKTCRENLDSAKCKQSARKIHALQYMEMHFVTWLLKTYFFHFLPSSRLLYIYLKVPWYSQLSVAYLTCSPLHLARNSVVCTSSVSVSVLAEGRLYFTHLMWNTQHRNVWHMIQKWRRGKDNK